MSTPPRWIARLSLALGAFPLLFVLLVRAQLALGRVPAFPESVGLLAVERVFLKAVDPFFLLQLGTSVAGGSIWPWVLMTPIKRAFWFCVLWIPFRIVIAAKSRRRRLGIAP